MQPARHIAFSLSARQNCPGVFNAADEAEICSRLENYGRNPDPSNVVAAPDHQGGARLESRPAFSAGSYVAYWHL